MLLPTPTRFDVRHENDEHDDYENELDEIEYENERLRIEAELAQERADIRAMDGLLD